MVFILEIPPKLKKNSQKSLDFGFALAQSTDHLAEDGERKTDDKTRYDQRGNIGKSGEHGGRGYRRGQRCNGCVHCSCTSLS